ncbi:UbiA family prenyltransferase [bacterium]|nr:UbiA family prenyltransferase [bacterium]
MIKGNQANAWLQLFRLPNLFTVPGEALVGGMLAGVSTNSIFFAGLAFLFIYMGGLAVNDIVDYEEDSRERSWRPLPAGWISKSKAVLAAIIVYSSGLIVAFFLDGLGDFFAATSLIIIVTLFYNLAARKIPPIGWTAVALCRALIPVSLYLMSDRMSIMPWIYSMGIFTYIWIISAAAYNETRGAPAFPIHILLPFSVVITLVVLNIHSGVSPLMILWGVPAIFLVFYLTSGIKRAKEPVMVQTYIGKSIGAVLIFQGAALLVTGSYAGALLWIIYPFSSLTAKKYKGS